MSKIIAATSGEYCYDRNSKIITRYKVDDSTEYRITWNNNVRNVKITSEAAIINEY